MKGDFSRDTFDPRKHYSAVLIQQGRVQVDADWNEQQAIHARLGESAARDIIGASGAPAEDPGFQIRVPDGKTLSIGAGHFFVDGILCENETDLPYAAQPDLPGAPDVLDLLQRTNVTTAIAYLEVWRRHLTALDDPAMREKALGGPDTATRVKTVWQVKVLPLKTADSFGCGDTAAEWNALLAPPSGALHARARPSATSADPCILPPSAGYRRLENQLYRVEVHQPGKLGEASFKWSRDNGAVVTAIESVSGQELTVRDLGPDEVLGFAGGQFVEITTETTELSGLPGQLLQIDTVNPASRTVRLTKDPGAVDLNARPKLRRWDGDGVTPINRPAPPAPADNDGFLPLEDGVEIRFEDGDYSSGDYWLIPARTAIDADTGQIEWPFDRAQPPHGIRRHYARLGLLTRNLAALAVTDCRNVFRPLTGITGTQALHVVGINWANDDLVELGRLTGGPNGEGGLHIELDGIPARPNPTTPQTIDEDTLIVTLEAPVPAGGEGGLLMVARLPGVIEVRDKVIKWRLTSEGEAALTEFLKGLPLAERRVRVMLKGHAIWSEQGGRRHYLDGQAVGQPGVRAGQTVPRTDLVFPSGSGVRASDFESWFFVEAQLVALTLKGFTLEPPRLIAGATAQGTLTLSRPAPPDLKIKLSRTGSTPDPVAEPPAKFEVPVPAGLAFASFALNTKPNVAGSVIVQAELGGAQPSVRTLEVTVVAVAISPTVAKLFIGGQQLFAATVSGTDNKSVTWRVQPVTGSTGSVSPTGLFRAPGSPGTSQVIATSSADPTKSGTATVNVIDRPKPKDPKEDGEGGGGGGKFAEEQFSDPFIGPLPADARVGTAGRRRSFIRPEERPDPTPPPPKGRSGGGTRRRKGRAH